MAAFRNLPEEHMWSKAVLRFCFGCYDKEAGEKVAISRPMKLEQAIIKWAVHTHNSVLDSGIKTGPRYKYLIVK